MGIEKKATYIEDTFTDLVKLSKVAIVVVLVSGYIKFVKWYRSDD